MVLVPDIPEVTEPTLDDWAAQIGDLHLAEPSRILRLARAVGVLPERVLLVGCQPQTCEEFEERLSRHVAAAVPIATRRIQELVGQLMVDERP